MSLQVVHCNQRLPHPQRQSLRVSNPHQQRPGQSRPLGHRNRIQVRKLQPRLRHRRLHHRNNVAQVFAARQLRNHPPEVRVQRNLRRHHIGQHLAARAHHRRRRLVARALNPQNQSARHARPSLRSHLFIIETAQTHPRTDSSRQLRRSLSPAESPFLYGVAVPGRPALPADDACAFSVMWRLSGYVCGLRLTSTVHLSTLSEPGRCKSTSSSLPGFTQRPW